MIDVKETKTRIATIKTCWLEDDAISLNGRQYPKESVDRLIASAQIRLADENALPLTSYLSHDKADQDSTRDLIGKITRVWREGSKAYASIDVPDTSAGRDFATLVKGGYIKSQSLRAIGARMAIVPGRGLPQVTGESLVLEGIDCTTSPGLPSVARIEDISESAEPQNINEIFSSTDFLLEDMSAPYNALREAHDSLARVCELQCVEAHAQEAGSKLSGINRKNLIQTHNALAAYLCMSCMQQENIQPMEEPLMTPEEAARLLQEAGYTVSPPKTPDQLMQEKLDAMQAVLDAKLAEMQTKQPPQRRSLVEGATTTEQAKRPYYRHGDYLREQLRGVNREELLDRSRPLPAWMDPERALAEFQKELLGMYDAQFGLGV